MSVGSPRVTEDQAVKSPRSKEAELVSWLKRFD